MSAYSTLGQDARRFFDGLAQDNTREWWQANKATYDQQLKAPAMALLEQLSAPLAEVAQTPIKTKLFRPHRAVRFSKRYLH